ncbi:MAG: hypothetical protein HYU57_03655 [Micavibrio aeruginosavorus]|nr:hypothetical protein [Micavibrio aeruginosavorus]
MNIFELSKTRIVTVTAALALCAVGAGFSPASANENTSPAEAYLSDMIAATTAQNDDTRNPDQQNPAQNPAHAPAQAEAVLWPGANAAPAASDAETLNKIDPQAAAEAVLAGGVRPAPQPDANKADAKRADANRGDRATRQQASLNPLDARRANARPTTLARNNFPTGHGNTGMHGGLRGWVPFNE